MGSPHLSPASAASRQPLELTQSCSRCLYDSSIPGIEFDANGMCSYCQLHDVMDEQYPTGARGKRVLLALCDVIRKSGKGRAYDCVVGVSGGCDSSFLLYQMVELGLRPLAVHFDNTWNSPIATTNIYNVLDGLGVELWTHVVDNQEYDDIYRSFMLAGVPDLEAPTDIGLIATLYRAAEEHDVRYIVEGHSFRTEGISPLSWLYMDGRYIREVHRQFGLREMRTFPNLPLSKFVRWSVWKSIRRVRPLYYIDYHKEEAKKVLADELNWQWYGGHHLENRFSAFYHSYFLPRRFGIDGRLLGYSALVRSQQLDRQEAVALVEQPPRLDPDILELVKRRLRFDDDEFEHAMTLPYRSHLDYPTYERVIRATKPFWWLLYKADRVPKSFYEKFAAGRG